MVSVLENGNPWLAVEYCKDFSSLQGETGFTLILLSLPYTLHLSLFFWKGMDSGVGLILICEKPFSELRQIEALCALE